MCTTGRGPLGLVLGLSVALFGCVLENGEPPTPMGPSELGLSISLVANPGVLPFDGASQSRISIDARDPNGQPVANLALRIQTEFNGVLQDMGRLSARSVVTGADGRAVVVYTAPFIDSSVDSERIVKIIVIPTDRLKPSFTNSGHSARAARSGPAARHLYS